MKLDTVLVCPLLFCTLWSLPAWSEDWSRFRGPNGSGVSTGAGYPTEFGPKMNAAWRTAVRPGKSSPVLTSTHVFLTASDGEKLYTQCFDRKSGKLLWEQFVVRARHEDAHRLNDVAANTPVTDGENVYVLFKDYGLVSYDAQGALRWKSPLGQSTNSMGLAGSPILAGGLLVLVVDQQEKSYIAGFDMRNGELRWKSERQESEAWNTPLVYQPASGAAQIITAGARQLGAHSVDGGKRLWTQPGLSVAIVASPVLGKDTVYAFGYGYEKATPFSEALAAYDTDKDGTISAKEAQQSAWLMKIGKYDGNRDGAVTEDEWIAADKAVMAPSSLVAVRLEKSAQAADGGGVRARELWRYEKSFIGVVPSPLLYRDALYVMKSGGILTSFDPETGKVLKAGRVNGAIGGYSASPVAADGRLYLASEDGKVAVVQAGREWSVLTVNDVDEPCFSTPALSEGHIYLRAGNSLYCFGGQ